MTVPNRATFSPTVVLLDPATGLPINADNPLAVSIVDGSIDAAFNPDTCSHAYGYTSGVLTTDTATDGASTWIKTYSYTSGNLTGETNWVKQ